jgi:cytochrome b561
MATDSKKYHTAVIALHWVMALCFGLMLLSGFTMAKEDLLPKALRFNVYQWHKSLGVILLLAIGVRIALRIIFKPPSLPALPRWEITAAKIGHTGLYGLMILMPVTGWLTVSSSVYGLPTIVFGLFEWPHIPGVAANAGLSETAAETHEVLALFLCAMIAVHVLAVIKHYVMDKINLLPRIGIGKVE